MLVVIKKICTDQFNPFDPCSIFFSHFLIISEECSVTFHPWKFRIGYWIFRIDISHALHRKTLNPQVVYQRF